MASPSQAQYRQVVQHYAREGAISPRVRQVLERQRQWLKLLPQEAQAIEQSVLQSLPTAEPNVTESNTIVESIAPSLDLANLSFASGSNEPILIPVSASLRLRISVAVEPTDITAVKPTDISIAELSNDSVSGSTPVPALIESEPVEEKQRAIEAAKPTLALPESAESSTGLEADLEEQVKLEDLNLPEGFLSEDLDLENFEDFELEGVELESLGLEQSDLTNLLSLLSENPSNEELQSVISQVAASKEPQSLEQPINENSLIYHRNRERYRAEFKTLIYQQYPQPLSAADRSELKQLQQNLQIADEDVTAIEAQVLAELHQKISPQIPSTSDSAFVPPLSENETEHGLENLDENAQANTVAPVISQKQSEQDYFATPIEQVINPEMVPAPPEKKPEKSDKPDEPGEQLTVVSGSSEDVPSVIENNLSHLEEKLYSQQWREADRTTFTLMLHLAKQNRWLDEQALKEITDKATVQEIDRLWRQYSQSYLNQEFGFRAQCVLYQSLKPTKVDRRIARQAKPQQAIEFVTRVGWWTPRLNCFRVYEQLDFPAPNASNTARPGHLPALWFWAIPSLESFRLGGIGTGLGGCRLMVERLDGMLTQMERLLQ